MAHVLKLGRPLSQYPEIISRLAEGEVDNDRSMKSEEISTWSCDSAKDFAIFVIEVVFSALYLSPSKVSLGTIYPFSDIVGICDRLYRTDRIIVYYPCFVRLFGSGFTLIKGGSAAHSGLFLAVDDFWGRNIDFPLGSATVGCFSGFSVFEASCL